MNQQPHERLTTLTKIPARHHTMAFCCTKTSSRACTPPQTIPSMRTNCHYCCTHVKGRAEGWEKRHPRLQKGARSLKWTSVRNVRITTSNRV